MSEFPFFRLEPQAITEVFRGLQHIQLFNISLCSTKSFQLAKALLKTKETSISTHFVKNLRIHVSLEDHLKMVFIFENLQKSVGCSKRLSSGELNGMPYLQSSKISYYNDFGIAREITFYVHDEYEGFKLLKDHLNNLYSTSEVELVIDTTSDNKSLSKVFNLMDFQLLNSVEIRSGKLSSEESLALSKILDRVRTVDYLSLRVQPDQSFIDNDTRVYQCEILDVRDGTWVTPQRLLTMNCEVVHICDSNLTSQDINWYLKRWINGECSNMQLLTISGSTQFDSEIVLADIPNFADKWEIVPFHFVIRPFNIMRDDGTIATVSLQSPVYTFSDFVVKINVIRPEI